MAAPKKKLLSDEERDELLRDAEDAGASKAIGTLEDVLGSLKNELEEAAEKAESADAADVLKAVARCVDKAMLML